MYKSKEMRWFFQGENKYLQNWFDTLNFSPLEEREDIYLNMANNDIGIKLREGNIEMKHRVNTRSRNCLTTLASGYLEDWTKWSFKPDLDDPQYISILNTRGEGWTAIAKMRNIVQITFDMDKIVVSPPYKNVGSSCQMEYTNFSLKGEKWFTVGFEWLGEIVVKLNSDLIEEILGNTKLTIKQSMSYPEFLKKLYI